MSPLKLRNMMTTEGTWMTAADARKMGFVDSVIALRVAACAFDLKAFGLPDPPSAEPAAAPAEEAIDLRDQIANARLEQLKSRGIIRATSPKG